MSYRSPRASRIAAQQRTQRTIALIAAIIILAAVAYVIYVVAYNRSASTSNATGAGQWVTTGTGLRYQDVTVGSGAEAKAGDTVSVHYTGWLQSNNQKFDSSLDRNQPFEFQLGAGRVIQGWDQGVAGMKVGGKRKLEIPPDLGYGSAGSPPVIPANATLIFDVELLAIK